ncbi:gamma-aminobutyric acid type B receptor subunit 2-like [Pollicipes pollicipes]|uniref:gamma-aminobutyric acid type B receptor subunit 2-like n=1 Tax=Pollicipes pollicipes TaxID=41117 RepID=UPI0018854C2E|nr:gamma-aminobutyric acid type B receptor subunit 2-like [Pollicipes pollicipes]
MNRRETNATWLSWGGNGRGTGGRAVTAGGAAELGRPRHPLSVLGLFDLDAPRCATACGRGPLEGRADLAAARLALQHVNRRRLVPGYRLRLITNNTKCSPGVGVDAFFHALHTRQSSKMIALLGTGCSEVTEQLAQIVPYWNILQMSFGSFSPALSDRTSFPLFFRTSPPESAHNPARLAFVAYHKWDAVATLSQNSDEHTLAINDLVTELENNNITLLATATFDINDYQEQLQTLKDRDVRIIIGSFAPSIARRIFCEAYRLGMYGDDYAWLLYGGVAERWWRRPSSGAFRRGLRRRRVPVTRTAALAYDALWSVALALRHTQREWRARGLSRSLHQFDYSRADTARDLFRATQRLNFTGVSGPVSFNGADRRGLSAFYQLRGGNLSLVALYDPRPAALELRCAACAAVWWPGGQAPVARRLLVTRVVTVSRAALLPIVCLASLGVLLSGVFFAFNVYYKHMKQVKLSSPKLNSITVVGCMLVYVAVVLLGLDYATLSSTGHFSIVCTARVYLLSIGFSLAFGAMFAKTFRVHQIFVGSRTGVIKNRMLQDTQLMSLILVLLLFDCVIVTVWVTFDPMQRQLRNLTMEYSAWDRGVAYLPQVEVCYSQHEHKWLGALYAYKGLLLTVAVYMAWETRGVKIPALNDSRYIGLSVYNVVITSVIVVTMANAVWERVTLAFVLITSLIIMSTTTTLCLLFVPKIHSIIYHADQDPVTGSLGLRVESNTRRLLVDDRKEIYYRAEVQNRCYRREVIQLDREITGLEQELSVAQRSPSSTGSSESDLSEVYTCSVTSHLAADDQEAELLLMQFLPRSAAAPPPPPPPSGRSLCASLPALHLPEGSAPAAARQQSSQLRDGLRRLQQSSLSDRFPVTYRIQIRPRRTADATNGRLY